MKQYFEETGAGKAFFELLRAGLWGREPEPAFFTNLQPDDWRQILGMAQKQAVLGLIYAGVSCLPKPLMPEQQTVLRLYGLAEQIRRKNQEIAVVTREICGWFEEVGLEPIVLKGHSVGAFYADPELRQPGDLDLLFHRDYDRVVPTVRAQGIDVELDKNHDKFTHRGILVELHSRPFHLLRPIANLDLTPDNSTDKSALSIRSLNLKANALLLLLHPAVHFMEAGLGLRQLCDWAVFVHDYAGRAELDEAWQLINEQGAGRFACEFTAVAVQYLGLEEEKVFSWIRESNVKLRKRMLAEMLDQGNFGSWKLPASGDWSGLVRYGLRKMRYAFRVYVFCPIWLWQRFPLRLMNLLRRLGLSK